MSILLPSTHGYQTAEMQKTLKEDGHKIRQQEEHIKMALDALMKCIPPNNNQRAEHGGNSSHNNNSLPQAEEVTEQKIKFIFILKLD
jgi:hypothetical protein